MRGSFYLRRFRYIAVRCLAMAALACATACSHGATNEVNDTGTANATHPPVSQPAAKPAPGCPAPLSWGAMRQTGGSPPPVEPQYNRVTVDPAGNIYWNGAAVDLVQLRQYLDVTVSMNPVPMFVMEVDPRAPCETVTRIVAITSGVLDCSRLCSYAQKAFDQRAVAQPSAAAEPARRELIIDEGNGRSIWSTSVYSYAPGSNRPGGGRADGELRIGGWGDTYVALLMFDLQDRRPVRSATLMLREAPAGGTPTPMELAAIDRPWSWRAGDRLWWRDLPPATAVARLAAPTRSGRYTIDLTSLYNQWASGALPNHGLMLRPLLVANNFNVFFSTRASVELRPRLLLVY